MADSAAQRMSHEAQKNHQTLDEDGLTELRQILLGPEQAQLVKLQERLDNFTPPAEVISQVLPEAILLRTTQDKQLTKTLLPTVEEAISISVQKNPQTLVDALFPVIGPAIRRAVAAALREMIQSLNQLLEHSLSFRSVKWRLEALRTGKSFAEVVLFHTLLYRVEQVFLIHKETGLLLHHVVVEAVPTQDAEVISGMLTAMQDFVRDSFGVQHEETLEALRVGDVTIWVEQGPQAIIAAVIRGNAPVKLRSLLQDALETIHLEQKEALDTFQGDATPFQASRSHLATCLQAQYVASPSQPSFFLWIGLIVILSAIGLWGHGVIRDNRQWTTYLDTLRATDGIIVTSAEKRGGTYVITGLRDPLAVDPMLLLQATKLNPEKVNSRWEPYYALYPEFILTRAKALLEPPATVTLTVKNGILSASGVASQHWNREARRLVRVLPGITQFDDTNLVDPDHQLLASIVARLQPPDTVTLKIENGILYAIGTAPHRWIVEVRQLLPTLRDITQFQEDHLIDSDLQVLELRKEQLEKSHLYFERGGVQLTAEQNEKLQRLRTDLEKLFEAAQAVGQSVHIEIVGHSDTTGSEERINKRLSQERADAVLAALTSQGIDTTKFTTLGMGSKALLREEITEQDRALNRRVSFRVMLTDAQPSP